jgi:hypothetical protein
MTTEWVLWHPTLRFAQDGALDSVAPLDNPDSRVFGRDDDALGWWYPTLPLRVAEGSGWGTRVLWLVLVPVFFFGLAVGFFYVFHVPAVFLGGEGDAFAGVADGADAVGMDVDVLGVGRCDLESVEEEAGAAGVELVGGEGPGGLR